MEHRARVVFLAVAGAGGLLSVATALPALLALPAGLSPPAFHALGGALALLGVARGWRACLRDDGPATTVAALVVLAGAAVVLLPGIGAMPWGVLPAAGGALLLLWSIAYPGAAPQAGA